MNYRTIKGDGKTVEKLLFLTLVGIDLRIFDATGDDFNEIAEVGYPSYTVTHSNGFSTGRQGQTYRVPYRNPNPKGRSWVDFDDYDADTQTLVDVKKSVRTTEKGLDQAGRQLKAAHQAGVENVVWRVPNQAEKLRAMAFFKRKGITGIDVEVSP